MRRLVAVAGIAGVLALGSYLAVTHTCGTKGGSDCDCTAWLREEFALDEATCARVMASQREFAHACHGHCQDVAAARAALAALPAGASAAAREAAARAVTDAESHCLKERIAQAHRIAAMLPEAHRQKYLDLVLPRLRALDHAGAPGVNGTR